MFETKNDFIFRTDKHFEEIQFQRLHTTIVADNGLHI